MGPWIVHRTAIPNPQALRLTMRVNGEVRQNSTTANMIFTVAQMIAVLSAGMTLEPGDILATGTPEGVGMGMKPPKWLQVGDEMEAEIEGIGRRRSKGSVCCATVSSPHGRRSLQRRRPPPTRERAFSCSARYLG